MAGLSGQVALGPEAGVRDSTVHRYRIFVRFSLLELAYEEWGDLNRGQVI